MADRRIGWAALPVLGGMALLLLGSGTPAWGQMTAVPGGGPGASTSTLQGPGSIGALPGTTLDPFNTPSTTTGSANFGSQSTLTPGTAGQLPGTAAPGTSSNLFSLPDNPTSTATRPACVIGIDCPQTPGFGGTPSSPSSFPAPQWPSNSAIPSISSQQPGTLSGGFGEPSGSGITPDGGSTRGGDTGGGGGFPSTSPVGPGGGTPSSDTTADGWFP